MTRTRTLILMTCMTALASLGWGQSAQSTPAATTTPTVTPPRIKAAEAKNHIGEMATVCGKVVDSRKIGKYGLGGYGKPVTFDLDQPETNSVFYFVTFGVLPEGSHHGSAAPSTEAQPNTATPANGAPSAAAAPHTAPPAAAPPAAAAPPDRWSATGCRRATCACKTYRARRGNCGLKGQECMRHRKNQRHGRHRAIHPAARPFPDQDSRGK